MWKRVISILRSFSKIFREINKMMPKKIFYILTVPLQLTFFAYAQGPNGPMGNWGHMMGYGYGGGSMWLIILALVGVAVYFLLQVSKSKTSDRHIAEQPLDILKKRYAKGEIDKEEFDRKKKDMES
jgi:putative membrane protein